MSPIIFGDREHVNKRGTASNFSRPVVRFAEYLGEGTERQREKLKCGGTSLPPPLPPRKEEDHLYKDAAGRSGNRDVSRIECNLYILAGNPIFRREHYK